MTFFANLADTFQSCLIHHIVIENLVIICRYIHIHFIEYCGLPMCTKMYQTVPICSYTKSSKMYPTKKLPVLKCTKPSLNLPTCTKKLSLPTCTKKLSLPTKPDCDSTLLYRAA